MAAGRFPEDNEMPGLHLLRQEQHCEKQRMFTAKAPGGHELKPLDVSLLWVILLLGACLPPGSSPEMKHALSLTSQKHTQIPLKKKSSSGEELILYHKGKSWLNGSRFVDPSVTSLDVPSNQAHSRECARPLKSTLAI